MSRRTWTLEDHLCRNCSGRMLKGASGFGPTGGGNPVFKCADCGVGGAEMGPTRFCWCGFHFKGQEHMEGTYMCLPFSILNQHPSLREAFMSCGSDPDSKKALIGIVTTKQYREALLRAVT